MREEEEKKKMKKSKIGHTKKGRKRKKMTCLRRVFPLLVILSRERKYPVSAPVLARIPNSHQNR
jgi:hypothetical protein